MRHAVYARELGQHPVNAAGTLCDALDGVNLYLIAKRGRRILGFVSITPPTAGCYSIDKYIAPDEIPLQRDAGLFEVRLLTVASEHRQGILAGLLMYAALRHVEAHHGTHIVAMGRREILPLYRRLGLQPLGRRIVCGRACFELLTASVVELRRRVNELSTPARIEKRIQWKLDFPFQPPAACFHGGASFDAIGTDFRSLERRHDVVNADVLDAWFDPSPRVLAALSQALPWLARTSPPAGCEGLVQALSQVRGIPAQCIVPGAGSSDLIFRALGHWITAGSRVALLDPTYGEYQHVLGNVIHCPIHRIRLSSSDQYALCEHHLQGAVAQDVAWIILVNPNSPTGRHVPRAQLQAWLADIAKSTRVWIDETYIDYVGPGESLESFAAGSSNVVICKSMSKVYALSGLRCAYLCGPAQLVSEIRAITPPWVIGLPSQLAAVIALGDPGYYRRRYRETHGLRARLAADLSRLGFTVTRGCANFLLVHIPPTYPTALELITACRRRNIFLRDASTMGTGLGPRALRIAVKSAADNRSIVHVISDVLRDAGAIRDPRESATAPRRSDPARHPAPAPPR